MTESSESRHGIQVLDRANRLLARLEASSEPLALTTLARETGLSASTAHRILGSLSAMGFVKQNPAGQWSLGLRLLELGNLVYERFTVRQRALPFMQQLHAATGMTVNLAIRDNDRLLYIEHVLAPEYKANQLRRIGSWAPLHITSGGKLFLARMSPDEIRGYTERTGLKAGTQNSIQSLDHLLVTPHARETAGLMTARVRVKRTALPRIFGAGGRLIATISLAAHRSNEFTPERIAKLCGIAQSISSAMGAGIGERIKGKGYGDG
ncbi:MAG: IclR family transcriptional regulator [Sutterella wadsworthensis]